MKGLLIILSIVLFSFVSYAQWDYKEVTIPETVASDSFKITSGYYFSGIQFPNNLDANMDTLKFLVSVDPKGLGWDTLEYNGSKYIEVLSSRYAKAVSLKFPAIFQWQWWKVLFDQAITDSTTFYPTYTKFK